MCSCLVEIKVVCVLSVLLYIIHTSCRFCLIKIFHLLLCDLNQMIFMSFAKKFNCEHLQVATTHTCRVIWNIKSHFTMQFGVLYIRANRLGLCCNLYWHDSISVYLKIDRFVESSTFLLRKNATTPLV